MTVKARIYSPAKTAMQSGRAKTRHWVLEYEPERPRRIDALTGWTSSADMGSQVRLQFPSRKAAEAYAKTRALVYRVDEPAPVKFVRRAYADNFKSTRRGLWTH